MKLRVTGPDRGRRIAVRLLIAAGVVFSVFTLLSFAAAVRDDYSISKHIGRADADVLSVGYQRTVVRFITPDGQVHVPVTGVLYPLRLQAGTKIRVEYDTADPDLVRVAGRDWTLGLLPVGTTLLGVLIVVGPGCWLLTRRRTGARDSPAQVPS